MRVKDNTRTRATYAVTYRGRRTGTEEVRVIVARNAREAQRQTAGQVKGPRGGEAATRIHTEEIA